MREVTEKMREKTQQAIRRIAELKIEYYGLDDTVNEYIEKSAKRYREKLKRLNQNNQ